MFCRYRVPDSGFYLSICIYIYIYIERERGLLITMLSIFKSEALNP